MMFIVQFEDIYEEQPQRLPDREKHMAAHLSFLADHGDCIVAAGALRLKEEGVPSGGIWIVNTESISSAEDLYKSDPFWLAGLRKSVRVSHWAKAYWSTAFMECMDKFND